MRSVIFAPPMIFVFFSGFFGVVIFVFYFFFVFGIFLFGFFFFFFWFFCGWACRVGLPDNISLGSSSTTAVYTRRSTEEHVCGPDVSQW